MSDAARDAYRAEPCEGDGAVLRQSLQVTALRDGFVYLEGQRASACAGCAAKTGCGAGALAKMVGGTQTLRLPYSTAQTGPLSVGDIVTVAMDRRAFLGAALRAYLMPPAALVATAVAAIALGLPDWATALLCVPALGLGFLPLVRADRRGLSEAGMWIEGISQP